MSYVTDVEKSMDVGDYRYFVTRLNQETTVTRHLLSGNKLDLAAKRETVLEQDIPAQLVPFYRTLRAGNMPAVA